MFPSRSRLEAWNPDSLTFTGRAILAAGQTIEQAVGRISNNLKIMPETKSWAGPAHDAATGMFDRAHVTTTEFCDYTTRLDAVLQEGASVIGAARKNLLAKADEVDLGPLSVSEGWVVLIDPGSQTSERIAALMDLVATEQAAINELLVAVDKADNDTAQKVMAAAKEHDFVPPSTGGLSGMMLPGGPRPSDDVPDPREPLGLLHQATVRGEEMATTIREVSTRYNEDGHFERTLIMQDGSRQVITEYKPDYERGVPDMTTEYHYDKNNRLISWSSSTRTDGGYKETIMNWSGGPQYVVKETPEGVRTAAFNMPDGRSVVLPPDSPLLVQTIPERIGDVFTGLDTHIDRGGKIPMLSAEATERVGPGAKYGGAALSVMSSMYDFLAAPTPTDKCVSVFAGTFGLAGNAAGAAGGAAVGGMIPVPGAAPVLAVGTSIAAGEWMKSVGTKVGEVLCGP